MVQKIDTQTQLDQIEADILAKNICPDLAQTAKQLVMGSGNPNAHIVFIGEAPGKNEDETGKPFVGASGVLLDEMLSSIGMSRSDIYITNIVKYRPPNNRDPSVAEKQSFFPFLAAQLAAIRPKLIITLGRHPMNQFLPKTKIAKEHGKLTECKVMHGKTEATYALLPLYHPAAALYNGGLRQTLFDDFSAIPAILRTTLNDS